MGILEKHTEKNIINIIEKIIDLNQFKTNMYPEKSDIAEVIIDKLIEHLNNNYFANKSTDVLIAESVDANLIAICNNLTQARVNEIVESGLLFRTREDLFYTLLNEHRVNILVRAINDIRKFVESSEGNKSDI